LDVDDQDLPGAFICCFGNIAQTSPRADNSQTDDGGYRRTVLLCDHIELFLPNLEAKSARGLRNWIAKNGCLVRCLLYLRTGNSAIEFKVEFGTRISVFCTLLAADFGDDVSAERPLPIISN
jgi:hypothetical protein